MNPLSKTALLGFIRFQLVLGLMLFLPAWSLRFWQAWIFWGLFSGSVLFITLYFLRHDPALIQRRLAVGSTAEREKSQKIIQAIAGVLCCAVVIIPGFDHCFHWSAAPTSVVVVADAMVVLGLTTVFRVFKANTYTASTVQVEPDQQVVSSGPYAWVRHPMYAGSILGFLATPFALGSIWGIVPAALLCIVVVVRLVHEERYLSKNLPGYAAYCQRVRYRLVPRVW
jgi:protein-S-isoprenylcysteine O-methyltransferase Ste14